MKISSQTNIQIYLPSENILFCLSPGRNPFLSLSLPVINCSATKHSKWSIHFGPPLYFLSISYSWIIVQDLIHIVSCQDRDQDDQLLFVSCKCRRCCFWLKIVRKEDVEEVTLLWRTHNQSVLSNVHNHLSIEN